MNLLLVALLLGLAAPAAAGRAPEVEVTAAAIDGSSDAALARDVSLALLDAGWSARARGERGGTCRLRCVRVSVRQSSVDLFVVEVGAGEEQARTPLRLDPQASPFDRAHALAVAAELLVDRPRSAKPRPWPRPRPRSHENDALGPFAASTEKAEEQTPAEPSVPAVGIQKPSNEMVPVTEERLAMNVALTTLGGTTGGLVMFGATVGLRFHVDSRIDVRAAIGLLRPQRVHPDGVFLRRELLPLQLAAVVDVPRVPDLRAGLGVELISIAGDLKGQEMPAAWSPGPIARLEYRRAIRSFALLASVQGAYHHASWIAIGDGNPLFVLSPWTVSGMVGFEFRIL